VTQSGELSALSPAEKRELLRRLLKQRHPSPLSVGQQQLWFMQQLALGSAAYHFPIALRIRSRYDPAIIRRSLQALVDRHAAFRTVFVVHDGEPMQVVHEEVSVAFAEIDASAWSEAELRERVSAEADRPIDLSSGPVFRAALFRRHAGEAVLLLVWHHIVLDGWSLALVLEELSTIHAAYAADTTPFLPPTRPYTEFVRWQRALLSSAEGERQAEYWRTVRAKAEGLELPTDHRRPMRRSYRGGSVFFTVGESLTDRLRALATAEDTTPFVVLLAGFEALLHRITGQEVVPVSFPVNGRTDSRFARSAGYFVNQLAVTGEIGDETSFRELVRQTRDAVLGALEHQDYPPALVGEPAGTRVDARRRWGEVLFILQKSQGYELALPRGSHREPAMLSRSGPAPSGELGGLRVEAFPLDCATARFDLELQMIEQGGALVGWLQYDSDLFEETSARALVGRFQRVLSTMAEELDLRVSRADLLDEDERRRLDEWNRTLREWPDDLSIIDIFERRTASAPDAIAAQCGGRRLTFGELNARANRIANRLVRAGVRPGEIVGLCVPRSLEMLEALIGIVKAGCTYLPLDPSNPLERLRYMAKDSGAGLVITSSVTCGHFRRSSVQQLCLECDAHAIDASPDGSPERPAPAALYVVYTSGSTGEPKGVCGTHEGALNRFNWMWERYPFEDGELCAQTTTIGFVDAVWETFGPLLAGVPIAIITDDEVRDASALVRALRTHGVTRITLVPSLLRALLEREDLGRELPLLRYWSCSGEAMEPELARRFHERVNDGVLLNLYGCSEAAADSCCFEVPRDWTGDRVPIGRPIANTQLFIIDRHGNLALPGSVGEIYIGGRGLAAGYLGRPELTAERFVTSAIADGGRLYRSGDLGRQLGDGTIEYFGRADQQLKIRGNRVEPGEVEAALRSHPAVERAAVTAMAEPSGDRALVAYVVSRSESPSDAELRTHIAGRLPGYMLPSYFIHLEALPLTATGKLDRRSLPLPDPGDYSRDYIAPRTDTERRLCELWAQILDLPRMGVDDDFFERGGHSILALRAAWRTSTMFDRHVPVTLLFEFPTVARFAEHLDGKPADGGNEPTKRESERTAGGRHRLITIEPGGDLPPLFWIPGGAGTMMLSRLRKLSSRLGSDQPFYALGTRRASRQPEIESVPERASEYVKIIRGSQPEGPYFLAGFCLGGAIAFEAAQQLVAQGERVAFLGLVNSWMPADSIPGSQWLLLFAQRALYHLRTALGQGAGSAHRYLLRRLRAARAAWEAQRKGESAAGTELGVGEDAADGAPMGDDAILRATVALARSYAPQQFNGKVCIFVSAEAGLEGVSARIDPRRAWRRVCRDCEAVELPGEHDEMFDPPLVDVFARELGSRLRAVSSPSSPRPRFTPS
jgi:amino acid adenylation domain-containing protein